MSNPQTALWPRSAEGVSDAERGTSDRPLKRQKNVKNTRIKEDPNGGVFLDLIAYQGQYYAKYEAIAGTWVSYAAQQEGLGQSFPRQAGYGAYFVVLDRYFKQMADPDRIEPGDIFYVPTGLSSLPDKKRLSPQDVFSTHYMTEYYFKNVAVLGEGTVALANLMQQLAGNIAGKDLATALSLLAVLRNKDVSEIAKHYDLFAHYRSIADNFGAMRDDLDPVAMIVDPDFWAHAVQLRYGKIIGDVLGIDPVFGALLNPTGGKVGPGDQWSYIPDKDSDLGWHGAFHDAGGYLINYQGIGPGYAYIPGDTGDPNDKFSGQVKGLDFWDKLEVTKRLMEKTGLLSKYTPQQFFKQSPL